MINWKVRFRNGAWVASFFSQLLILIQFIIFGLEGLGAIDIDMEKAEQWHVWLLSLMNVFLVFLAFLGIVSDPTVQGVGDSARVLKREEPLSEIRKKNDF